MSTLPVHGADNTNMVSTHHPNGYNTDLTYHVSPVNNTIDSTWC